MPRKEKLEDWELQLIREADARKRMHEMLGEPSTRGRKIAGARRNDRKTAVATVVNRDKAAVHVGFAKDRIYG